MQRLTGGLVIVLAVVLAAPLQAAPTHDLDAKAKAGRPKAGARVKVPIKGGPNDESALWWNDPGIAKALTLTEEQRQKMDALLAVYRQKVPRDRGVDAFHETLVQGTWTKARSENKRLSEIAGTSVQLRGQLKIDILSLLTKEQHEQLVDGHPRLIYKPWMRAMRGAPR